MIRETLRQVGGVVWGTIKRVGILNSGVELQAAILMENARSLVFIVDYQYAKYLETIGKAVLASLDESYCHAQHHGNESYLLVGAGNATIHDIHCAVRDGDTEHTIHAHIRLIKLCLSLLLLTNSRC